MADYQMGGYIEGETPEEYEARRRREAELQAQAEAAPPGEASGSIQPARPGVNLGDLAGRYIGNRVNTAMQGVNNAVDMIQNPQAALEQRLGVTTQPDASNTEVQSQQVKTYADGSQEHVTKTQVPAPAPVVPQQMPAAPVENQSAAETARLQQQNATAQGVPTAPVAPDQTQQAVEQVQQQARNLPQPGAGVQVAQAGAVNPAEVLASYKHPSEIPENRAPVVQQAPAGAPGASMAQMGQAVIDAHNEKDPAKRQAAMINILATGDEASKQMAKNFIAEDYMKEKKVREAEKQIDEMTPTDAARYLKERNKEGSYVKAILFARLGLTDLARQEQEKLSPSLSMSSEIGEDGQRYSVVRDKEGFITKAFDTTGKETNSKTLASLNATAMATKGNIGHAGATRVRDSNGNEWSVVPTTRGSQFFDNSGKPGVPTGKTVPITVGGDVGLQRELAVNRARIALEGKKGAEAISVLGDLNKKNQAEGLPTVSYDDIGMNDKGEFVARPGAGGTAATTATAGMPTFKDPSIEIISAQRPAAEQQAMYDAAKPDLSKDPSGQTRYNAAGNPVARPGTSAHEGPTGNAFDVNSKKLTRAGRAELAAQGYYQPIPQQDPNHWERLPGQGAPAGTTATSVAEVTRQREQAQQVGTAEQKEYVSHKATVQDASDAGRKVSQITRTQTSDLMNDPAIIGIMNGSGTQNAAAGKLLREMVSGAYAGDGDNGKRLADDIRGLSISQPQKDALSRYAQMNTSINSATLKSNVGAGSVSNAEQTMNQRANMTNIGDLTPFAALNGLGRRQFTGDMAQEKANMINTGQYKTRSEFEQAWNRVEDQRVKQYEAVYRGRLDLIKPFAEKANANPNDAQAQQRYRDAAIHAFRVYPNPEYTPGQGWTYKTRESKMAAMAAAAGDR